MEVFRKPQPMYLLVYFGFRVISGEEVITKILNKKLYTTQFKQKISVYDIRLAHRSLSLYMCYIHNDVLAAKYINILPPDAHTSLYAICTRYRPTPTSVIHASNGNTYTRKLMHCRWRWFTYIIMYKALIYVYLLRKTIFSIVHITFVNHPHGHLLHSPKFSLSKTIAKHAIDSCDNWPPQWAIKIAVQLLNKFHTIFGVPSASCAQNFGSVPKLGQWVFPNNNFCPTEVKSSLLHIASHRMSDKWYK